MHANVSLSGGAGTTVSCGATTPVTRLDYCQYLLVNQINYTLTNFADHSEQFSHDTINRYLRGERITPRLVWDNVQGQLALTPQGFVIFDDTVLDKNSSFAIELVRRQYSGNAHGIVKGIGVVTCVYVNPETDQFWLIDYRIYDPEGDGKTKLDHVREMLSNLVYHKQLPFRAVLMDTWYATKDLMLFIESLQKNYSCPSKTTVKWMIRAVIARISVWTRSRGSRVHSSTASGSRSKAFRKTTRCSVFGLRCLPTAQIGSSPTILLKIPPRPHKRCAASAGKLSNCTAKANKSRGWNVASAVKLAFSVTTSGAPFLSGRIRRSGGELLPHRLSTETRLT